MPSVPNESIVKFARRHCIHSSALTAATVSKDLTLADLALAYPFGSSVTRSSIRFTPAYSIVELIVEPGERVSHNLDACCAGQIAQSGFATTHG